MPFPDLPPERIPGSPGHLNDHQLIDQALDYIQQSGYRDDPNFPPLPDVPVLGQSGHVTAHDRILAILEYVKGNPSGAFVWATVSNTPTGTYKGDDGFTYAYYLFESDGTLTVTTAGLLDALIVSGGSGGKSNLAIGMGAWTDGLYVFDAQSHAVKVGAGGAANAGYNTSIGRPSSVGPVTSPAAGWGDPSAPSIVSVITGTSIEYARADQKSPVPHRGDGGNATASSAQPGSSGVVIVRTRLN